MKRKRRLSEDEFDLLYLLHNRILTFIGGKTVILGEIEYTCVTLTRVGLYDIIGNWFVTCVNHGVEKQIPLTRIPELISQKAFQDIVQELEEERKRFYLPHEFVS